jgi:hypothetical protein
MRVIARSSAFAPIRRVRLQLVQVLADRDDLGDENAVVQLQRRHLAGGVAFQVLITPVLAAHQVDLHARDLEPLLGHEHLHDARIGTNRVVEFHRAAFLLCTRRVRARGVRRGSAFETNKTAWTQRQARPESRVGGFWRRSAWR